MFTGFGHILWSSHRQASGHLVRTWTKIARTGLVSAEKVARDLVREVRVYQQSEAALGPHLADQWALPLALAVWKRQREAAYTCTELTAHAQTNIEVIEQFLSVTFSTSVSEGGWRVTAKPARKAALA